MQNRCYSGRPATLPVLKKMGISPSTPNSPAGPHICTARFLSLTEDHEESQCMFVWDGSILQLQFTLLPLVISGMEAMFSTSLWRNQLSVLTLPFPPPPQWDFTKHKTLACPSSLHATGWSREWQQVAAQDRLMQDRQRLYSSEEPVGSSKVTFLTWSI